MIFSQFVERQDLEFAKKLVTMSLHDMGLDPYTGRLDSGYSNTGISKIKEEADSEIFSILRHEEPDDDDLISGYLVTLECLYKTYRCSSRLWKVKEGL